MVQACKAMKRGEWRACRNYLINDKMNLKVCLSTSSLYLLSPSPLSTPSFPPPSPPPLPLPSLRPLPPSPPHLPLPPPLPPPPPPPPSTPLLTSSLYCQMIVTFE